MKKKGRKLRILAIVVGVLIVAGIAVYIPISKNIRFRMLMSVFHMSEKTLGSSAYLLNDIDIQKLCIDYGNGDTSIKGSIGLSQIQDFKFSLNIDVDAKRSFEQKRMFSDSLIKVLRYEVGSIEMYGENEIVYFNAPILGDMSYAFNTGRDMFPKMPELTSDIDREWFKANKKNIYDFMQQITIDPTGEILEDEDGTKSEEYKVTIPVGSGAFLWELMGMEAPTKDVVYNIFLTKDNYIRRVTMDLSDSFDGGFFMMDGVEMGNLFFECNLPDNEHLKMYFARNPEYTHRIDVDMIYDTKDQKQYELTCSLEWLNYEDESGFSMKARKIKIFCDGEQLAGGSFTGDIKREEKLSNIFEGKEDFLYGLDEKTWQEIRDETGKFVDDVMEKLKIF